ncbi:unnamed protein product [Chrysodeixis includens]|uniref:GON-4-like protein n=1 Tax=Chrysodeixis includens TaxID=689277 RepID=A0A9P0BRU7_CHRIL|nr:unnamed protein product [Chrysodeixis includens]
MDDKKATKTTISNKDSISPKIKGKNRGKKRKRESSDSSSENEDVLPDNTLEMEKNLHASAVKNNLDDISVRKILKKVVTNDHVLALVKLREEEEAENGPQDGSMLPKFTRAKRKELMKVGDPMPTWPPELTPIKHIPVKTRPEVKALIAQELPDDEDDEEYEPTNEDVPSDDDHGLESCSDLESQPRTPATPRSIPASSPNVVKDGPFKVPQDVSTPIRRKLDLEEEATIALRTRSKLSLSSTSIEHIESTFVPPDDIPPAVDDLWNEFLNECLNPASTAKEGRNEDDDETDPEYNVAADADTHDEDEEALSHSIIKISKKELNDLVTELLSVMPEGTEDELMTDGITNSVLTEHSQADLSRRWEGKQEPVSDEEAGNRENLSDKITFEEERKKIYPRVSIGKSDPVDSEEEAKPPPKKKPVKVKSKPEGGKTKTSVLQQSVTVKEQKEKVPPLLRHRLKQTGSTNECILIEVGKGIQLLPGQLQLLQQQLRQHVQLAASNYLQLYIHPVHWKLAHHYKDYLETLVQLVENNPSSVADVCNLRPALELVNSWEAAVSADTPENAAMLEFIQKQMERTSRRLNHKALYVGEFHETFLSTVANSRVFLYPYLLPAMPYRGDTTRRLFYLNSEDE